MEKVEDLLIRLINTSELMIHLGYAAVIYNNKDVAKEVLEMEKEIDDLHINFELEVLKLKGNEENEKSILGLIRLGLIAERLSDAAALMADIVYRGIEAHDILRLAIEEAEDTIIMVAINENSILIGKSITELNLESKIGTHIIGIKRGDKWIYNPSIEEKLSLGDIIIAEGNKDGINILKRIAKGMKRKI
ncbi:MAG: TrkA C-terminal domain-containing protein [Nitrososphaerota archaeon]